MFKLVVLSCVVAVACGALVAPLAYTAPLGYAAPLRYSAPLAYTAPLGWAGGNYRGPLLLAPGQPANVLAADGRPLETLDVNLDRSAHIVAKAFNGHLLKKRSVAFAPFAAPLVTPLATPLAAPLASRLTYAHAPLITPTHFGHVATVGHIAPLGHIPPYTTLW